MRYFNLAQKLRGSRRRLTQGPKSKLYMLIDNIGSSEWN